MGFYDGGQQPKADHDPTQQIQWDIQRLAGQLGTGLMKTVLDLIEAGIDSVRELIKSIVDALVGFVTVPEEMLENLSEWATGVVGALQNLDLFDPDFNINVWVKNFVDTLLRPIGKLLGLADPIPAQNLYGSAPSNVLGLIPLEAIGANTNWNFLANPIFSDPDSLEGSNEWFWDGTKKHSSNGGSVYVVADGFEHELYSDPIEVLEKQIVPMRIWTWWEALVATGRPVSLWAVPIIDDEEQEHVLVDDVPSPLAGTSAAWTLVEGSYTVPAGITHVAMKLYVGATATAGKVWYSDGSVGKSLAENIVKLEWIEDLIPALDGIDSFVQAVVSTILEVLTGLPFVGWLFEDLEDEINSWFMDTQETAAVASDAKGGVTDMIDAFLKGWNKEEAPGGGWSFPGLDDFFQLGGLKSRELSSIAAGLAQLQADNEGSNNSGLTFQMAASDTPSGFPATLTKFYDSGSGALTNDGNTWQFGNVDAVELFIDSRPLLTTYPKVSLIVPKNAGNVFGSPRGGVYFIFRANHPTAPTEYCFARFAYNRLRFGCVKAGFPFTAPFWFGPEIENVPYATYMSVIGGNIVDDRNFQFAVSGAIQASVIDSGDVSMLTPAHVYCGWGAYHTVADFVSRSPEISNFIYNDNAPAPTVGSFCRIYRNNTAAVAFPTAGGKLPNGFMDSPERTTPGFTPITAAGGSTGVQVDAPGLYDVELAVKKSTPTAGELLLYQLRIYVDAAIAAEGGSPHGCHTEGAHGSNGVIYDPRLNGIILRAKVYCPFAGDIIYPGYVGASFSGIGAADGITTYMLVSKG